jgi:hypothetical protein
MTNAIETAIIALIQQHAKPEIDYAILADRLHDSVCDNVDYDAIKERVVESLDIDASDVARHIDASDIACDLPMDEIANEVCLSSLASEIDLNALSEHIAIPDADSIKDVVMRDMEAKLAAMSQRIADLEAKLAQPQPQPQPSTPTQMIERAKNLLADALGMLSNPTA